MPLRVPKAEKLGEAPGNAIRVFDRVTGVSDSLPSTSSKAFMTSLVPW